MSYKQSKATFGRTEMSQPEAVKFGVIGKSWPHITMITNNREQNNVPQVQYSII